MRWTPRGDTYETQDPRGGPAPCGRTAEEDVGCFALGVFGRASVDCEQPVESCGRCRLPVDVGPVDAASWGYERRYRCDLVARALC